MLKAYRGHGSMSNMSTCSDRGAPKLAVLAAQYRLWYVTGRS